MKKLGVALIAVLVITVAFSGCITVGSSPIGFNGDDLTAPALVSASIDNPAMPSPMTAISPPKDMKLSWVITEDIYAGYGGELRLYLENTNSLGRLYIYSFGLEWDTGLSTYRNCSVYIPYGEKASLGLLTFAAPSSPGMHNYRIVVKVAASEPALGLPGSEMTERWRDYGAQSMLNWESHSVQALGDEREPNVDRNILSYYNRINSLVNYEAAQQVADAATAARPGEYSILQVVEAFEWVQENIRYLAEATGEDHWQSPRETLELGTGDCEDHAILMASAIGKLGGNARVNIIQEHAFATVFIGATTQDRDLAGAAVASYYGLDPSELNVHFLQDDTGYWLIVDTTGFPHAGGIPAQSAPTSEDGDWSIKSNYIYPIDATGRTESGFFGL